MPSSFKFKIIAKDPSTGSGQAKSKARVGKLQTPHGEILTPNFNPVGTQATVKTLSSLDLQEIGAQIVLSNTHHLFLRPGVNVIEKMGVLENLWGGIVQLCLIVADFRFFLWVLLSGK